jgi:hypothetical protein
MYEVKFMANMAMSHAQSQAAQQAAQVQAIRQSNIQYMRNSIKKFAYCPVSGGTGTTAQFNPGVTLTFDLPVVGSGYAKGLLINYNLSVTPATGTGATYALNAAAPFNIFSQIQLNYNGAQARFHPYLLKLLDQFRLFQSGAQNAVLAGNNDNTISNNINGASGLTVGSANTWQGKMYFPFNAIADDSVPGVLPVMGVGNKPQIQLTCCSSMLGPDPLLNPIAATGGTGNAINVTGTINIDMVYVDGTNMFSPIPLTLDISVEPTLQYYWDTPLNPLNSGLLQRQHINTLLEHYYVVSLVIDGNQSNKFSSVTNLQQFELSPDSVGQQTFVAYNVSNNISVYDYYYHIRSRLGQDLDEGVVLWVAAPLMGIHDPSNHNGRQTLNMQNGGYPATTHGYMVGSVGGVTQITPRVETFLISMNHDGLRIV